MSQIRENDPMRNDDDNEASDDVRDMSSGARIAIAATGVTLVITGPTLVPKLLEKITALSSGTIDIVALGAMLLGAAMIAADAVTFLRESADHPPDSI